MKKLKKTTFQCVGVVLTKDENGVGVGAMLIIITRNIFLLCKLKKHFFYYVSYLFTSTKKKLLIYKV